MLKRLIILFTILLLAFPASASNYASKDELIARVSKPGTHYILFSGDWCPQCKILQSRLGRANIIDKVIILDISKKHAFSLIASFKIPGIPSVVVAHTNINIAGKIVVRFEHEWHIGLEECLFFLMVNLNRREEPPKVKSIKVLQL